MQLQTIRAIANSKPHMVVSDQQNKTSLLIDVIVTGVVGDKCGYCPQIAATGVVGDNVDIAQR